ncbi:MAG: CBS domain-containing protein [Bacteroidales bacterium]
MQITDCFSWDVLYVLVFLQLENMFDEQYYHNTWVPNLMRIPPEIIQPTDSMQEVMNKFRKADAWNLPVVDDGKYVGIISKSSLFSAYREQLTDISENWFCNRQFAYSSLSARWQRR